MVFDRMSLKSKTAVVTGAAHGIGKACALALAEAGADVAVIDLKIRFFILQMKYRRWAGNLSP